LGIHHKLVTVRRGGSDFSDQSKLEFLIFPKERYLQDDKDRLSFKVILLWVLWSKHGDFNSFLLDFRARLI
jgi:hypothetical protein